MIYTKLRRYSYLAKVRPKLEIYRSHKSRRGEIVPWTFGHGSGRCMPHGPSLRLTPANFATCDKYIEPNPWLAYGAGRKRVRAGQGAEHFACTASRMRGWHNTGRPHACDKYTTQRSTTGSHQHVRRCAAPFRSGPVCVLIPQTHDGMCTKRQHNPSTSSQTSTNLYDHEPFETFVQKVHSLLIAMFPNELPIHIYMERLSGGSYNRVVRGVLGCGQHCPARIIVRIPRFTYCSPVNDVAVLRFWNRLRPYPSPVFCISIDLPAILYPIPFMILEHLQGSCLSEVYDDMPAHLMKSVARAWLVFSSSSARTPLIPSVPCFQPLPMALEIGHAVNVVDDTQDVPPSSPASARSIRRYFEERWSSAGTQATRSTCDSRRVFALPWISCPSQTQIHPRVSCCIIQTWRHGTFLSMGNGVPSCVSWIEIGQRARQMAE